MGRRMSEVQNGEHVRRGSRKKTSMQKKGKTKPSFLFPRGKPYVLRRLHQNINCSKTTKQFGDISQQSHPTVKQIGKNKTQQRKYMLTMAFEEKQGTCHIVHERRNRFHLRRTDGQTGLSKFSHQSFRSETAEEKIPTLFGSR